MVGNYAVVCACGWKGTRDGLKNSGTLDVCCPHCRKSDNLRDGPVAAPHNNAAHAPATREDIERRIEAAKDRRYEVSMSNGRAYSDGSLTEIDRDIRILENQLARLPKTR